MQLADLDLDKTYTYADYLKWQFEERVELINGKIFKMSPGASTTHQRLSSRLENALFNYLKGKRCEVFDAPFDVRLPRKTGEDKDIITVLQPDICVICDPLKIEERGCMGAPDIVIEILSPSNNKKKLKNKYDVHEEAGVKEYWVVIPNERAVQVNVLSNNRYIAHGYLYSGDKLTTDILPGFTYEIEELFENIKETSADIFP